VSLQVSDTGTIIPAENTGHREDEQLANPQNLRPPWPKGVSGNQAGHSQGRRFTAALIQQIDHNPTDCKELVKVAIDLAMAGDFPMWKALIDRIDGPVRTGSRAPRI
jgi:hypothetical protein